MAGFETDYIRLRLDVADNKKSVDLRPAQASEQAIVDTRDLLIAIKAFNAAVKGDHGLIAEFSERHAFKRSTIVRSGNSTMIIPRTVTEERDVAESTIVNALAADYKGRKEYSIRFDSDPHGLGIEGEFAVNPKNMKLIEDAFKHAADEASKLRKQLGADGSLSDDDHAKVEVRARQTLRKDLGNIR